MKQEYLPKVATRSQPQDMAITEAHSGFDTAKIKTFAEKEEPDDYLINGEKTFISRIQHTDIAILLARTTPLEKVEKKFQGISCFLIDVRGAKDSLKINRMDLMCRRAVDTNTVWITEFCRTI